MTSTRPENNRETGKIIARFPGHMLHLDVKKVGKIPDGGGWRLHGRGHAKARKQRVGYTYLHTAIDGYSRLAYTEALENETAATTIGFFSRARAFFAAHGINRLVRVVTDNGSNYRAKTFVRTVNAHASRHQRTRPYMPRHNGKVERYQRILARNASTPTPFTPRTSAAKRSTSGSTITTIIARTPPALISHRPPESTNVSTTS